jgi:hypothetical protein
MSDFPPRFFVVMREGVSDADDPYADAREGIDEFVNVEDGEPVAVYQLVKKGRLNLTREFVEDAP